MRRAFALCAVVPFLLGIPETTPAQINGGLEPGTCVATTFGFSGQRVPANDAVWVVDTFAQTATRLQIRGFPGTKDEGPWPIELESRLSFLVGTARFTPPYTIVGGNVYRVAWSNGAWVATRLNSNTVKEAVTAIAVVGDTIYFGTTGIFSNGNPASAKIWSVPRRGGTASIAFDLSAIKAEGTSPVLVALGTTLHAFTFKTDRGGNAASEHWAIDTTRTPVATKYVGGLPQSIRPSTVTWNFAPVQAQWDEHAGAIVIAGGLGDVLWRDPVGNNLHQQALPTMLTNAPTDYFGALTIDTDTGALIIGDKERHIEELRCAKGRFLINKLTLPMPPEAWIAGLAYVPGAARFVPDGPVSCLRATSRRICSYVNSRPTKANASFALTLETTANRSLLLIGTNNMAYGSLLLPFDLTPFGAVGCSLGTSAEVILPVTGANPSINVPLPNMALTAYAQWVVFDPIATALGIGLSEARRIEVR